jgi:hypothetical protein
MRPVHTEAAEEYRAQVRQFLDAHLPSNWTGISALPHAERVTWVEEYWRPIRLSRCAASSR